jgi:decaprenylphospho-beta-D-ribofuranose 2-oxidase
VIAGVGRSYGDAAQNGGAVVVDMTPLNRIHSVGPDAAIVDVEAGVSLDA